MTNDFTRANRLLSALIDLLDIPPHYYELAKKRYESLAEWFHRDGSAVATFDPAVYPQGSFRLGTVIRPLVRSEEYDLDLVSELQRLSKSDLSQFHLKRLVGNEVTAYAKAKAIKEPPEDRKRCWRLDYADEVRFHMDILPAIPDEQFRRLLPRLGVPIDQARYAIAITDKTDARYHQVQDEWPRGNAKGYASWFEGRMRAVALPQLQLMVQRNLYASVDDVPAYVWKTPLQRAIQLLKRHRDVMFRDRPDVKPISMIITTLAARAYDGEGGLYEALNNTVRRMPHLIRDEEPRIPNPVNPAEDFADNWKSDSRLEASFRAWLVQVTSDVTTLATRLGADGLRDFARRKFALDIGEDRARELTGGSQVPAGAAPTVVIAAPPRPWSRHG